MKKEFDILVYLHPNLKKLIMELKIAFLITLVSVSSVLASPAYSQVAKVSPDLGNQSLDQVIGDNLLALASTTEIQQQIRVSGTVTDASTGQPMAGVNVQVRGANIGAVSDANGKYALPSAIDPNAVLLFSFIGYVTQEVPVGGKVVVNTGLSPTVTDLEEVIVVGYGTQKKVNLTGAITAVSGTVLQDRPLTNLGQGLQGVVPNLQVTTSNFAPGLGATFNIRGMTSINPGSPLFLVDGVVQDPNLLNPDDIDNISILKDAASAAIYGARAAYGVILVTTKTGKKGQRPTLNFTSSSTFTEATNIPKYANSKQYIDYMNMSSINAGGSNYFDDRLIQNALNYYNDPVNNLPVYFDPAIDLDGKYKYCGNTDWAKELYKTGALHQINASISGGTDNTKYYFSYGYMKQLGFLKAYDDQYQRHNVNLFVDTEVLKWLSLSGRIKYNYSFEDHPGGGTGNAGISAYTGELKNDLRPLMPVRHPDGTWAGQGSFTNPFAVGADGGYDQSKINDVWLTGTLGIHPIKDLNLTADISINPYSSNRTLTVRQITEYWAVPGKSNLYPWTNPNSVALWNNNNYYTAINAYLDYSKSFNNHNLKLLVGYNQEVTTSKAFNAKRENLISNDLPSINIASGTVTASGSGSSWATQGVFVRFNYDYNKKYLLEFNGRYDGSSKFPKSDRFQFYPSFSGGWRISEESFFENLKSIINEAKIRASYGSLGNQNVPGNFPYISNYNINTATSYILGGVLPVSIASGSLVSPSFTWEKVNQWNLGADFGFIKNKLTASFDIYERKTIGMLTTGQPLPTVLGTSVPRENAADLKTYGWESTIKWRDKIGDFSYDLSFNIADAQSEITKFNNPTGSLSSYYVGQKLNEIWGYEATGLFQSTEEIANHPSQTSIYGTWNPGDVSYVDLNNDGIVYRGTNTLSDPGDLKVIGNSTQRYQWGGQINASWKGLDIAILLQGIAKCDQWISDGRFFGISSEWDVPMQGSLDSWSTDNTGARLPRSYIDGEHGNRQTSTLYLQNRAYLRLKQASLGYSIPEKWSRKAAISRARIYLTGQNLLTVTKLSKLYDPENLNLMGYPVPKSYSVGINLTF